MFTEDVVRETLEKVIEEALFDAGVKRSAVQAVCLGLSGVNHQKDQEKILGWLRSTFPSHVKLYIQNDAVAALASGTMGKLHGCVFIAGTGSISYGFTEDGREARAAGAGPVLGDWGSINGALSFMVKVSHRCYELSLDALLWHLIGLQQIALIQCGGYGIAARALIAVMRAHDGRGPQTVLSSCILQSLGLSSPDELIGWTYADPSWARIAALVPVVVSQCERMVIKLRQDLT
ncbi:hypothetical protein RND71_034450 [Anisodus tanguticus]|uniref:N-acetyl-D-glucosamine kinase n=1 Tax=Anisodus tanguticus TaxID=243964 RepID=A0AAE1RBE7_9SOLA|nr:hypothetical protein RND71_034450 [Anisodus tanguticus]